MRDLWAILFLATSAWAQTPTVHEESMQAFLFWGSYGVRMQNWSQYARAVEAIGRPNNALAMAVREFTVDFLSDSSTSARLRCADGTLQSVCVFPERHLIQVNVTSWDATRTDMQAESVFVWKAYLEAVGLSRAEAARVAGEMRSIATIMHIDHAHLYDTAAREWRPRSERPGRPARGGLVETPEAVRRRYGRSPRPGITPPEVLLSAHVGVGVGGGMRLAEVADARGMRLDGVGSLSVHAGFVAIAPLDAASSPGQGFLATARASGDLGDGVPVFQFEAHATGTVFPAAAGLWVGVRAEVLPQLTHFIGSFGLPLVTLPFRVGERDLVLVQLVGFAGTWNWNIRSPIPETVRNSGDNSVDVGGLLALTAELGDFYLNIQGTFDRAVNSQPLMRAELTAALSVPLGLIFSGDGLRFEGSFSTTWSDTGSGDQAVTVGGGRALYEVRF